MKPTPLIIAALTGCLLAAAAQAETPNRATMSFPEFVAASGCVIVEKGGYSNLAANDGGNCPSSVTVAFRGGSYRPGPGDDGIFGTPDDHPVSDN